ncbi:hypothetical protein I6A60_19680 [Frankia sp. AgB1.9]|uniref:WapI family immunity protein n=1 Tax=unclassified Frankia TaxID=2632575 RepID=UPI001933CD9E|nr:MULTISPECIES: hypothetical protein [unclassified Frankia]MBL7492241.1 hypothetical protein [Frankia sp. AgW1.1]MBL7550083.1 hypothetical protein [Frankia sp. AgB1.9]MBL7621173.1 hypothetical protein [Frankia sp. AgB1.8]
MSATGSYVDLRIDGYQFPEHKAVGRQDWDANWLFIAGTARGADGETWSFREPCLTTWEVRDLVQWLRKAAAGRVEPSDGLDEDGPALTFLEPCLGLSVADSDDESRVIRVHLQCESAPPSHGLDPTTPSYGYSITLTVAPADLRTAAVAWEEMLSRYPER